MECYYIIKPEGAGKYYLHTDNKFYLGTIDACGISPKVYTRISYAIQKAKRLKAKYNDNSICIETHLLKIVKND